MMRGQRLGKKTPNAELTPGAPVAIPAPYMGVRRLVEAEILTQLGDRPLFSIRSARRRSRAPNLGARTLHTGERDGEATLMLWRRSEKRRCLESDVDVSGPGGSTLAPNMGARDWGDGRMNLSVPAIFAAAA
jgi:hypothetical protein